MTPIDYIRISADVLSRQDLSDKAKMLLGLIQSFNSKGLRMGNPEIAKLLCTSPNNVTKLLAELKVFIRIENRQSRYRRIFYSSQNNQVENDALNPDGLSKENLLNRTGGLLNPDGLHTQSETIDITEGIQETEYSFTLRDHTVWNLPQEKQKEYQTAFPNIDIPRELLKARQWLIDNPTRRKTTKGMPKFLSGWLSRCKPTPELEQPKADTLTIFEKLELSQEQYQGYSA